MKTPGYKGHLTGSRKEKVHKAFDKGGLAKAQQMGKDEGLSPLTIKSWVAVWSGTRTVRTKAATLPVTPDSEFDLAAWKERVMKSVVYYSVLPRPGVKGTQHYTIKEAVKQAKKLKVNVIWAVDKTDRFAPLNPDDWKRYA